MTADLGKFISLKEFSSSNPCSFSARKKHKKAQDETKHEKKKLLKALIRYLCLINIPILPQVKKVEKKKNLWLQECWFAKVRKRRVSLLACIGSLAKCQRAQLVPWAWWQWVYVWWISDLCQSVCSSPAAREGSRIFTYDMAEHLPLCIVSNCLLEQVVTYLPLIFKPVSWAQKRTQQH